MSNKSTDQMIMDLVAAGFVLPEGLVWEITDFGLRRYWLLDGREAAELVVHDHCACEFARQADQRPQNELDVSPKYQEFREHMQDGDSVAAIRALWEGVCDG